MNALLLVLLTPTLGAALLFAMPPGRGAARANLALSALTFAATLWLMARFAATGELAGHGLRVDALNLYLVVLTAFIGLTTAAFSLPYICHVAAAGRIGGRNLRLYHAMYQAFMLTMLLALTTDNLGVLWVAIEGATLTTVLLISLYRTPEAVEAAWKYFILCGVGIALALFGTVLTYFAAQGVLDDPHRGLDWSALHAVAAQLDPTVMAIAFAFLLVGYGTKVGLVPMHQWLPDAHSEGPTPMSATLSGLLLNVAIYAVVRLKMLVDGSLAASPTPHLAGALLMAFGLVSFLVAVLFLHRQRDVKRLFSYSSIEHMGLIAFGFGLGGPAATFAALLHMLVHSLTKSAIFVTVGHACQIAGSQSIERIRGLIRTRPAVGWSLLAGMLAIAGLPPFGVFVSEFLLLRAAFAAAPWAVPLLLLGLIVAAAGLLRHVQPMVYGAPPPGQAHIVIVRWPILAHFALVLWIGLALPSALAHWLAQAGTLITGGAS